MSSSASLRYLTPEFPGLGGRIKTVPEDFLVEELPVYEPCGEGEHLFLWIEKRAISSEQLLDHLAQQLGIGRGEIGMAGLKDRQAVTRQYVSVPRRCARQVDRIDADGVRVLKATPHRNKLRAGHLTGNRFVVRLRDIDPAAATHVPALMAALSDRGFPNAYGEQRFGWRGETAALGLQLIRGERTERSLPPRRRRFLLRLALSAAQSLLFNRVLAERLDDGCLQQVLPGDVLQVRASGGVFLAEDVPREQARLEAWEVALTGPMFGPKMKFPTGIPAEREARVLQMFDLSRGALSKFAKLMPGARRPLVMRPSELRGSLDAEGVRLEFVLPPGCYATSLLREICKTDGFTAASGDVTDVAAEDSLNDTETGDDA